MEVRFKGSRKEFYRNEDNLELFTGDPVVVQRDMGSDLGHVSLKGELVRLQLKKYNIDPEGPQVYKILRKASERDLEKYQDLKAKEPALLEKARTIAMSMGLKMKLSDIEVQGDGRKVIFFYTAEERVDFRELIKAYAEEFRMRIEMKQIGYRQEAARLGGIGSCGRELCCSTWLTDFKVVNMSAARYQNLSINMLKLSGQCGRLKCCLNYELDTYLEALEEFPSGDRVKIDTEAGFWVSQKVDILKRKIWFAQSDSSTWIPLEVEQVNEYIALNKEGKKAPALYEVMEGSRAMQKALDAEDIISDNSLDRMMEKEKQDRKRKKKKRKGGSGDGGKPTENRQDQQRGKKRSENKSGEKKQSRKNPSEQSPKGENGNSGKEGKEGGKRRNNRGRGGSKPQKPKGNENAG